MELLCTDACSNSQYSRTMEQVTFLQAVSLTPYYLVINSILACNLAANA